MNNWKDIYNKKERVDKFILEMLIKADGFDSPTGKFDVDDWNEYIKEHYNKAFIQNGDTIYEVGCGSGAFLYPLYKNGYKVGGVDFAEALVNLAKVMMPESDFVADEAINLSTEDKYDIVLSHGVFVYFKYDYAEEVLNKMMQKSKKIIAIFDINDKEKEENYHKIRMETMSKEEYEKKYEGLNHYFYEKSFFEKFAKNNNLEIEIFDQTFDKYNNAKFRFNVIMRRR